MTVDTHFVLIDKVVAISQLFNGDFFVGQTIVSEIPVTVVVIPFRPCRVAAAISDGNYNEAELSQCGFIAVRGEGLRYTLRLRARIDVFNNRV